jgi:tellurite resistance protein TerC
MELTSVGTPALWAGFILFVLVMLALDLGVFHRKAHVVKPREALAWSAVWVALALAFNGLVWWWFGSQKGLEFLTGYLIEKSLAVDNIFVFVLIFSTLAIPPLYQHRVLFWGVLGALVMRAVMIAAGASLLARFHWLIYVFGAFLVLTGAKMLWQRNAPARLEESRLYTLVRRVIPSTSRLAGSHFFTWEKGRRVATPLFLALVLVEVSDLVFAVDSIPAIFAVTSDPFIVFTSNIFAILGLRSMYFLLAGLVERFAYLKVGLAAVLLFVGAKMTLIDLVKVPAHVSLLVIAVMLGSSVVVSLRSSRGQGGSAAPTPPPVPAGQEG